MASLFVLTGAGISAESGVQTFRGAGGLWEGRRIEDVATPEAWRRDPASVWRFYQLRRGALRGVAPNAAHFALAKLEREWRAKGGAFVLVTQNVDDLHERAGSTPVHMHGELSVLRCERCGASVRDLERCDPSEFAACASCAHERLRPDVVWFGEVPYELDRIQLALSRASHFVAVGTSGVVQPAAGFLELARTFGAKTWVNSLDAPENLDPRDRFRAGPATEIVPSIASELLGELD